MPKTYTIYEGKTNNYINKYDKFCINLKIKKKF